MHGKPLSPLTNALIVKNYIERTWPEDQEIGEFVQENPGFPLARYLLLERFFALVFKSATEGQA